MKKLFFIVYFAFFALIKTFSADFSLTPLAGIKYGYIGESLYAVYDDSNLLSYLKWDEKPVAALGIKGQLVFNNFETGTDLFYGLPLNCGKMQDYDWSENKRNKFQRSYTLHDNKLKLDLENNLWIKYDYKPLSFFTLSPVFLINTYYVKFSSSDGYGYHGSNTVPWDSPEARYVHVSGIDYNQFCMNIFYGLDLQFKIVENFTAGIKGFLCPFTFIFAEDHHRDDFKGTRDFFERHYLTGFFQRYKGELYGNLSINKNTCIIISTSIMYGSDTTGNMHYKTLKSEYQLNSQPAGSNILLFAASTGVSFKI